MFLVVLGISLVIPLYSSQERRRSFPGNLIWGLELDFEYDVDLGLGLGLELEYMGVDGTERSETGGRSECD